MFVLLSILGHIVMLWAAAEFLPHMQPRMQRKPKSLTMVILKPEEKERPEIAEPEPPEYRGQIVEVAPPEVEQDPLTSDYLAAHNNRVEEETRSERFMINPEVLAKEYSKEQQAEQADVMDLNVDRPSTGATVGNNRFDPNIDGSLAALPSPWRVTNKEGPQDPIPSAQREAALAGAPQNDRLDEQIGRLTDLNTTKYPYQGYLERIRRQVNYWWKQNYDNLPSSVRLSRSLYTTDVRVILNSDGALELIDISEQSGSTELDDCVVRAFRMASPFANPPDGLIEKDGRVYLPDMSFSLQLQAAQLQYQGIDPRAGVQFPGILKSPR